MDSNLVDNDDAAREQRGAKVLDNLSGRGSLLEPARVLTSKHVTQYIFTDLRKGKYRVVMNQSAKPPVCINVIDVNFSLEKSLNELLSSQYSEQLKHNGAKSRFISKLEDW
jgi:hypothetical protein